MYTLIILCIWYVFRIRRLTIHNFICTQKWRDWLFSHRTMGLAQKDWFCSCHLYIRLNLLAWKNYWCLLVVLTILQRKRKQNCKLYPLILNCFRFSFLILNYCNLALTFDSSKRYSLVFFTTLIEKYQNCNIIYLFILKMIIKNLVFYILYSFTTFLATKQCVKHLVHKNPDLKDP